MRRTDCGRCQEAHCPSELMISKFRWQELSPYAPSNRSSKKLIYSIRVGGFRESKLSDSFLPVIDHCKRWPIDLHLRMILKLDDGWPESEKDVFQAALRMVVVKDSR